MADGTGDPGPRIDEVFPYLHVRDAAAAIDFYKKVFGAKEILRLTQPDGRVGHAEIQLGPAMLMLADEFPEYGVRGPTTWGGTGTSFHLHVDDVDALAERAVRAGAAVVMGPEDKGHGERQCRIRDPFGHEWLLGHPIPTPSKEAEHT